MRKSSSQAERNLKQRYSSGGTWTGANARECDYLCRVSSCSIFLAFPLQLYFDVVTLCFLQWPPRRAHSKNFAERHVIDAERKCSYNVTIYANSQRSAISLFLFFEFLLKLLNSNSAIRVHTYANSSSALSCPIGADILTFRTGFHVSTSGHF